MERHFGKGVVFFLLTVSAAAQPMLLGVRNSASGALENSSHPAAPNSILSVYVSNLGITTTANPSTYPTTQVAGVQVLVNGAPVPIYNLVPSASLINIQLPSELPASGTASVMVTAANGASQSSTIALGQADIGIFRIPTPTYPNNGAIQFANTSWDVMPASTVAYYNLPGCTDLAMNVLCGQPAKPGQNIAIYWTGGGALNNPLPTGSIAPLNGSTLYSTVQLPVVTIGGISAPVLFTGITPGSAGEYQINTTIPMAVQPGDQVPLVISIGNSSDTVGIPIQAP